MAAEAALQGLDDEFSLGLSVGASWMVIRLGASSSTARVEEVAISRDESLTMLRSER